MYVTFVALERGCAEATRCETTGLVYDADIPGQPDGTGWVGLERLRSFG